MAVLSLAIVAIVCPGTGGKFEPGDIVLMANAEPVASEPRLFVGQVPTDKTAEDLIPLFESFGVIKNLHLVKGPDGKSRGCAMVLFDRWSSAEAAMEKHDGKTVLDGGKGRALVVHFANPRKAGPTGMAPEQGVAPKKIFVGQVLLSADSSCKGSLIKSLNLLPVKSGNLANGLLCATYHCVLRNTKPRTWLAAVVHLCFAHRQVRLL